MKSLHKKYGSISLILLVCISATYFVWGKFSSHPAIGEWRRELCIGKENFKEDLLIFKDSTAISWLTKHGNCRAPSSLEIECTPSEPWGKEICNWSAKNNKLIILQCNENPSITRNRTFSLISVDHGLLDDKDMSRVTSNTQVDLFQVPPVCK